MNNSLDLFKDAVEKAYKMDYSTMTSYISADKLEEIISKQVKKNKFKKQIVNCYESRS